MAGHVIDLPVDIIRHCREVHATATKCTYFSSAHGDYPGQTTRQAAKPAFAR